MKDISMTLQEKINKLVRETREKEEYKKEYFQCDLVVPIYKEMKVRGITQQELAKKVGVKESYLSRIFSRKSNLTIKTLRRLTEALELEINIVPKESSKIKIFGTVLNVNNLNNWTRESVGKDDGSINIAA